MISTTYAPPYPDTDSNRRRGRRLSHTVGGDIGANPWYSGCTGIAARTTSWNSILSGHLRDCPVAWRTHQLHHIPVPDDAFLGQLKTCTNLFPSNHKERSKRAWLAFVEDFFGHVVAQAAIDLPADARRGGWPQLLRRKTCRHELFSGGFYERLAPELLTDVMGDLGEEGEHGIEDTIHEKVSKVIAAKRETERKAKELFRAENTLKQLVGLRGAVDDFLSKTRQGVPETRSSLY